MLFETAYLDYHIHWRLSRTFLSFFKTFQMNFCDSLLISNSFTLSHSFLNVKYFFEVFIFSKIQNSKRRRRDLNPRAAINDLLPFQGSPFGQLGYFSKSPYAIASFFQKRFILYRVVFYLSRTFLTYFVVLSSSALQQLLYNIISDLICQELFNFSFRSDLYCSDRSPSATFIDYHI